jgi:hypothetical protein
VTTYAPVYRLTVYAPRSVDTAEATVLTPAAGAPHADAFQVATKTGIAGFQPYLQPPRGRRGRIEPLTRTLDIGELTFELVDRTINGNTKRWVTAFLGNVKGRPQLVGLKVLVEESLDGGATFATFFTGRVFRLALGKVRATLSVRDQIEEAKMPVFVGRAHSSLTYVARTSLLPIGGMDADFGMMKPVLPLTGVMNFVTGTTPNMGFVQLDAVSMGRSDNLITSTLLHGLAQGSRILAGYFPGPGELPNFSGTLRARVKNLTSGSTGDFKVGALNCIQGPGGLHMRVAGANLQELDLNDYGYLALPGNGTNVEISLWIDDAPSKDNPLLLNDVHPVQLLTDLAAGKFGYLYRSPESLPGAKVYGDVKRTVPQSNFAAFVADTTYPTARFVITDRASFIEWVEKNILKPYNLALYVNKLGELTLVDLRLPTSLAGIPTITDADVVAIVQGDWQQEREKVITRVDFTRYEDTPVVVSDLEAASERFPALPTGAVTSFDVRLLVLDIGSADIGDAIYQVDATGFRSMDREEMQGQARSIYLERKLVEVAQQWRRPFGWGMVTLPVQLRRTVTLAPGGLALFAASYVPDPSTNQRGTTRLCRALEVSEDGAPINVQLLDLGIGSFAVAPSATDPAQETGNTYTGITSTVTLNASSQPVEVRYAVTGTGVGTVPVDSSPLWVSWGRVGTTGAIAIRNLPPNSRIWLQVRSLPDYVDSFLPSAWTNAGGDGRVDTAALPTVSSLTESHTSKTAHLAWTNGVTNLKLEITLATPTGDPRLLVQTLLPGSKSTDLTGLAPSTTYRAGVRYAFAQFAGAETTVDIATAASGPTAPALAGIAVVT